MHWETLSSMTSMTAISRRLGSVKWYRERTMESVLITPATPPLRSSTTGSWEKPLFIMSPTASLTLSDVVTVTTGPSGSRLFLRTNSVSVRSLNKVFLPLQPAVERQVTAVQSGEQVIYHPDDAAGSSDCCPPYILSAMDFTAWNARVAAGGS